MRKRVCVRACDCVRVTVCVSVCVQEGLGAESGVTPAPLFKPTSQLGIRPGVWHRSRRLVSLLRAWHCFHISAAGSPFFFCQGFLHRWGGIKTHQNQSAAPGFRRHKEKLLEEFVLLAVVVLADCISGAPCVDVNGSCSLWGPAMVRGLCSGSPESWGVDFARGLAKVAA